MQVYLLSISTTNLHIISCLCAITKLSVKKRSDCKMQLDSRKTEIFYANLKRKVMLYLRLLHCTMTLCGAHDVQPSSQLARTQDDNQTKTTIKKITGFILDYNFKNAKLHLLTDHLGILKNQFIAKFSRLAMKAKNYYGFLFEKLNFIAFIYCMVIVSAYNHH